MPDQSERVGPWPPGAWLLRMRVEVPCALDPPVVQYAVFSEDPAHQFAAGLKRMQGVYQAQLEKIEDTERRQIAKTMQLCAIWNLFFRSVSGDCVRLLTSGSGQSLMSNEPDGQKWLVTKAVRVGGRAFAWSAAFQAVPGKETEIELTERTAVDLARLDENRSKQ
jgi:hypothetical protein